MDTILDGTAAIYGTAQGELLVSAVALSFWGGVDSWTGRVIDSHHDLNGHLLEGKIVAIPSGRGSCASSGVMMELLLNGHGPLALLLQEPDDILAFGAIVSEEVFGKSVPIVVLGEEGYARLSGHSHALVAGGRVHLGDAPFELRQAESRAARPDGLLLSARDRDCLDGMHGRATEVAMRIIVRMAALQGAKRLFDVTRVHIDGCVYTGPASLKFAEQFRDWGGTVAIPTTLNAISVDARRWRQQGVPVAFGEAAERLGEAYVAMGAAPTFTCAPYLLEGSPGYGEQIAWAESNAVVYANSVSGARTMKYPDYLDACIALTGRAPFSGCHTEAGRRPGLHVEVVKLTGVDDSYFPLLGYHIGKIAGGRIPLICGLAHLAPTHDDLKAFSAAFATTSGAPMFHMAGVTPEAAVHASAELETCRIEAGALARTWDELNSTRDTRVGLVSLGNPHFSLGEFAALAELCRGRKKDPAVEMIITSGRAVHAQAASAGTIRVLEDFGARFSTDTCWCLIEEPVIPVTARVIITNSAKYAHYGPGLTGRKFRFGSLSDCVDAACGEGASASAPAWLKRTFAAI